MISSVISAEPAKAKFDLEIKNINLAEFRIREGLETKNDKSQNLTVLKTKFKLKEGSRTKID